MRSPSAILPTGCAAAGRSCRAGRATSACSPSTSATSCSNCLARRGFDIGEPDGRLGPRTRLAIRNFQVSVGQVPDGFASSEVLDRLRQP